MFERFTSEARAVAEQAEAVRAEVRRLVADPLASGPDAEALRAIGIDVERVRARVEESFGPGALAALGKAA